MKEEILNFKNYTLKLHRNSLNRRAVILFHGFPAETFLDAEKEKNRDLGNYLAQNLDIDVYITHYAGLGRNKDKEFNFISSITDSISLIEDLKSKYSRLDVVGHSWGGLVAINCISELGIRSKVLLMSPFNLIPSNEVLTLILSSLMVEVPFLFKNKTISDYLKELELIRENFCPQILSKITTFKNEILILQAEQDEEVPAETTMELQKNLPNSKLEIMETDHRFWKNREALFERAKEFFRY